MYFAPTRNVLARLECHGTPKVQAQEHAQTHTHTLMDMYIHTYIDTWILARKHPSTQCWDPCMYVCIYVHIHQRKHTSTLVHIAWGVGDGGGTGLDVSGVRCAIVRSVDR